MEKPPEDFKSDLALKGFVKVPENVSLDHVQATLFGLVDDVTPHLHAGQKDEH